MLLYLTIPTKYYDNHADNFINFHCHRGSINQLECGPMPNLMVALPNTGGALCSTPQSLADAHY